MEREQVLNLIGDGTWCTVEFTKADGSYRVLNGRMGVHKHLRGGDKAYDDATHNTVTVYENGNDYRTIRCDRIVRVKAHGEEHS